MKLKKIKTPINANINWQTLNLPHDWSIEGKFDKKSPAGYGGGALNGGLGWSKKTFNLALENKDKITSIVFDGFAK